MSCQEKDISDKNFTAEQSREYSLINDTNYSKEERIKLVSSMIDRFQLTLDDIRHSERPNALSMVPPDLLPLKINLSDGHKITLMETNPVVTSYDGELTNVKGNVIRIYVRNPGEELPEDFLPPRKMITVTPENIDSVLPSIIQELIDSSKNPIPGSSNENKTTSNAKMEENLSSHTTVKTESPENIKENSVTMATDPCKISSKTVVTNDQVAEVPCIKNKYDAEPSTSAIDRNVSTQQELKNITDKEDEETIYKDSCEKFDISSKEMLLKQSEPVTCNLKAPISPKFQVIGLIDRGVIRDSGEEECAHDINEDSDNQDMFEGKDTATIIVDKELGNPSDFRSVVLKTPPPMSKKLTVDVRKSSRIRKPKSRSPFKSWDDLKMRLPRHSRKGKISKGTEIKKETLRIKNVVKKLHQENKNMDSIN